MRADGLVGRNAREQIARQRDEPAASRNGVDEPPQKDERAADEQCGEVGTPGLSMIMRSVFGGDFEMDAKFYSARATLMIRSATFSRIPLPCISR